MATTEERLARLERRIEGLEERFNDVLESLSDRWATLSANAKEAAAEIARLARAREQAEQRKSKDGK